MHTPRADDQRIHGRGDLFDDSARAFWRATSLFEGADRKAIVVAMIVGADGVVKSAEIFGPVSRTRRS